MDGGEALALACAMLIGAIETHFTALDWGVVAGYMLLTTWIGHLMAGKAATVKDFFLGGKSLPWWAVCGSMIATEISALTFIGVPGSVYAMQGDWTYLQWGIGSIVARFLVGYWLVPLYYQKEIYSPYDFMGNRLGEGIRRLVTVLFSLGAILGQSVRVLVTAIILQTVTGISMPACILAIGGFAVVWTLMGGMRTVIWTDVIQFGIFMLGAGLALGWLVNALGWDEIVAFNRNAVLPDGGTMDKMRWLDFTSPFEDPMLKYTLWVGVLAMPFQNLAAFGTDQLNAQRMFCCGSPQEARKAMVWSCVSILITVVMLAVGAGLFAWYGMKGLTADEAAAFASDPNKVFPVWITTVLPPGLTGLILAGAFAAAISSLDSVLAALSQTSLSAIYGRGKMEDDLHGKKMVARSRIAVVIWAALLSWFAIAMAKGHASGENKNLITLAFGMVAYTYPPLLGVLLAAILPGRKSVAGLFVGTALSILLVLWTRPELGQLLGWMKVEWSWLEASRPKIASEWFFPLNALLTLACGYAGALFTGAASGRREDPAG